MTVAIRQVHSADLDDALLAVLIDIERTSAAPFAELGITFPPDDPGAMLRASEYVLIAGDPPQGFAAVGELDGAAHLEQISVAPSSMRQGVGTALLEAVIATSTAAGRDRLVLTTFRDIPWNGPWYLRHGFNPVSMADCPAGLREVWRAEIRGGLEELGVRVAMARPLG